MGRRGQPHACCRGSEAGSATLLLEWGRLPHVGCTPGWQASQSDARRLVGCRQAQPPPSQGSWRWADRLVNAPQQSRIMHQWQPKHQPAILPVGGCRRHRHGGRRPQRDSYLHRTHHCFYSFYSSSVAEARRMGRDQAATRGTLCPSTANRSYEGSASCRNGFVTRWWKLIKDWGVREVRSQGWLVWRKRAAGRGHESTPGRRRAVTKGCCLGTRSCRLAARMHSCMRVHACPATVSRSSLCVWVRHQRVPHPHTLPRGRAAQRAARGP